jgi:TonB family protein
VSTTSRLLALCLVLWSASLFGQAQTTKPDEGPWPPPGVLLPGTPGVTPPKLLSSIQALYTAEAMRARIQGTVRLSCVVELDGSIGPVRVVQSLDKQFGLDEQAIATARKWKFTPGVKDGERVRVLITIDLGFAIRDTPLASVWPGDFPPAVTVTLKSADWRHAALDFPRLTINVEHPKAWIVRPARDPSQQTQIASEDNLTVLAIQPPVALPGPVHLPMAPAQVQQFTQQMSSLTSGRNFKALGVGQVQAGSGWWIWQEFEFSAAQVSKLVPGMTVPEGGPREARLWMFTSSPNVHMLNLYCVAVGPAADAGQSADAEWKKAGAVFQEMIQRLSIQSR